MHSCLPTCFASAKIIETVAGGTVTLYYSIFGAALVLFALISLLKMLLFWKRVLQVHDVDVLSEKDRKLYDKYRTQWPHDKLAVQKIFETKLLIAGFILLSIASVVIYRFLSTYL